MVSPISTEVLMGHTQPGLQASSLGGFLVVFFCEGGGKIEVLDNVEGHTAWLLHTSYIYI